MRDTSEWNSLILQARQRGQSSRVNSSSSGSSMRDSSARNLLILQARQEDGAGDAGQHGSRKRVEWFGSSK
jgi:hypothetical protein